MVALDGGPRPDGPVDRLGGALLTAFGCTSDASETAALVGGDDVVGRVARNGTSDDVIRFSPSPPTVAHEGQILAMPFCAGESVSSVRAIEPVGRVLGRIVTDAERRLDRLAARTGV